MSKQRVSRREFIKLLGASGLALSLGAFGFLHFSAARKKTLSLAPSAAAQTSGSWSMGQLTTTVAIHASYLHNGFILYIAGSGYHRSHLVGPYEARLLNPETGFETDVPMVKDLFCHGSTSLSNGNILIAGGTLAYDTDPLNCNGEWHGISDAYEYDVALGQLVPVQSMAAGRWYPTLVNLSDGKIVTVEGFDEFGSENKLVEIYDETTKTWSIKYDPGSSSMYCIGEETPPEVPTCPGAGIICFGGTSGNGVAPKMGNYVRMHLLPSGRITTCGMHKKIVSYDPSSGRFTIQLTNVTPYRHYGTSVLLPLQNTISEKGEVMMAGGSDTAAEPATNIVKILDFNASSTDVPVVRTVQPMQFARKFTLPVILPDGKVILFGGSSVGVGNFVTIPEMFDPVTETWTQLPNEPVPRTYHGVALLLSDGRVWVAGSTSTAGNWELRTEFFSPWYINETRPTISGTPIVGGYGGTITIPTLDAADIASASLVRLMSATHHYEPNQRFLWLQIVSQTSDSVVVSAPLNGNLAPPGYYMIHILNSAGVPSAAKIILISPTPPDTTAPGQVTGLAVTPSGTSQLDLTWDANPEPDIDHYDVHRDTVSGFTPSPANRIAQPTSVSYSDTGLSSSTTYYYVVAAVDTSVNIGPASAEVAGTTGAGGEVFYNVAFPGNTVAALHSAASTRYGEEARVASSVLVGKSLKFWKVYLRKVGSPSGSVTAVVRRFSDDAVVATFNGTIDASNLSTSFSEHTFTLATPRVIQAGDRILIQYSGSNRIEASVWNTDQIDGTNTRRIRYGGTYIGGNTEDIAGSMSSDGGGDTTAPGQVTGLAVTPSGTSQLDLTWDANPEPDIDHYDVHRDTVSGFTPSPANRIAQPTSVSYSDTGLSSSTTYYYVVAAVDTSVNIGPASAEVAGTTGGVGEIFYDVPGPGSSSASLFTGNTIRYGEEARIASSAIVGKSLKRWKVYLRRIGSASGQVTAVVRRSSDDVIVATFSETLDATTLPTVFAPFEFTLSNAYVIAAGDRILVEYSGTNRVDISQSNADVFDGNLTRRTRYSLGGPYVGGNSQDIAGTMSSE